MYFISVKYTEPNQDSYKCISLKNTNNNKEILFDSGDFVVDHYWLNKYIVFIPEDKYDHISASSSLDHFIMDGDKYKSRFLKSLSGKEEPFFDFYTKKEIDDMNLSDLNKQVEVFVLPEHKTWQQVKDYVKSKKPELFDDTDLKFLHQVKIWD